MEDFIRGIRLKRGDRQALLQEDRGPDDMPRDAYGEDGVKRHRKRTATGQAEERGLNQCLPSKPSAGTSKPSAGTFSWTSGL